MALAGAQTYDFEEVLRARKTHARDAFAAQLPAPVLLIPKAGVLENDPFRTVSMPINVGVPLPVASFVIAPILKKRSDKPQQGFIWVGREPNCDVVLAFEGVSKLQAHFTKRQDGEYELRDANSTNGTFVDDKRLGPDEPALMRDQLRLRFAATSVRYRTAAGLWDELSKFV